MKRLVQNIRALWLIVLTSVVVSCIPKTEVKTDAAPAARALSSAEFKSTKKKEAKPGAPISLLSSKLENINTGEEVIINILLEASAGAGNLSLSLTATQGLNLISPTRSQTFKLGSQNTFKLPVILNAAENGRYYVNIQAVLEDGDSISLRHLAVIIQAGPETEKAKSLQKAGSEKVISLPAQEEVKTQ